MVVLASAVIITFLAVSGGGQASWSTGQAGSGSQLGNQVNQQAGGGTRPSGTGQPATSSSNNKSDGGNNPPGNNNSNPNNSNLADLQANALITAVTTVDESHLNQAALQYVKGIAGTTQGFKILETKISQIDPDWGRVTILNEGTGHTTTTYFLKQGGVWGCVDDLRDYFRKKPEAFIECAGMVKVLDVNGYTLELFGAGSKRDLFDNLNNIIPAEAHAFFIEQLVAIAGGRKAFEGETVTQTLRGERLHVFLKWTVSPESRAAYARVLVAIVDVTERVAAEEKLKESERLYRLLADNTQDLICLGDSTGRLIYISPSIRTFLGYEPEELMGDILTHLVHPEDRERVECELASGLMERRRDSASTSPARSSRSTEGRSITRTARAAAPSSVSPSPDR